MTYVYDVVSFTQGNGTGTCVDLDLGGVEKMKSDMKKQWTQIQDLQTDLMKKEDRLQSKTQLVKDLQQKIESERDNFEAALRGQFLVHINLTVNIVYVSVVASVRE